MKPGRASSYSVTVGALVQCALWLLMQCGAAFASPPPNDNFSDATDITASGVSGSVPGTNVEATLEPGEPNTIPPGTGASVWYRWTAPITTCVIFDVDSSVITYAVLNAFTGASVNSLTEVPRANHTGADVDRLVFRATAGIAYSVRVDGYPLGNTTGNFVLHWTVPGTGPPNDNFANADSIGNTLMGSAAGTNVDATPECGEPEIPNDGGIIYANSGRSIWYRWTAPANVRMVFTTDGSDFDTLLAVYTGSAVDALTLVVSNDDFLPDVASIQSFVAFDAVASQQYAIAVDGYDLDSGATVLNWTPAPVNDDFANATDLTPSGASGMITATNLGGTPEPGEPRHGGCDPGRSLWYRWTAPADGLTTFDTSGSLTNETVAVYTGSSVNALTPVLPVAGGEDPFVTFSAVAGTLYRIAVTGRCTGLVGGSFVLNWAPGLKPTATQTPTITTTPTPTSPPAATSSVTPTPSPTSTGTPTYTPTTVASLPPTPTLTQTAASTATRSPTNPATATPSVTGTPLNATATGTHTPTLTPSPLPTLTQTAASSATAAPTSQATATESATPTPSLAATTTGTQTPTLSPSALSMPTVTPSATATTTGTNAPTLVPSPTPTPIVAPTGTPSASPTSTPEAVLCVGNCNQDESVTVDEILTMVSIALGSTPVSACLPGDSNHDSQVTVDEILAAVDHALNGCAA